VQVVQALQDPPEYAMTLQVLMQNHTVEDRTARIADRTVVRTADRIAEVVVQDLSVCVASMRNVECQMDLRTAYLMDQEYQ
jgi:hypothetical protein